MLPRRLSIGFVSRSLRAKVTLGVVLPLVVVLGAFTTIENRHYRAALLGELSLLAAYSGQVIEDNLRHEMLETDLSGVQGLLDSIGESGRFRVVYLMDPLGRVINAPQGEGVGTVLDSGRPDCQRCHRLPPEERPQSVVVTAEDGQRVFRSMLPIENTEKCRECHDPNQRLLGLVLTDIPTSPLDEQLTAGLRENLLWWAAAILITVIVVNFVLSRLVLSRLERLASTLGRFGRGQHDLRLPGKSPDEIGRLSRTFNQMGQNIQSEVAKNRALSADVSRHATRRRDLLRRLITAQEEERRRVAHDLHDDLGQDLAGLAVSLEGMERLWADSPEPVQRDLDDLRARVAAMTDRAYEMILALRPSALDDLGLVPALHAHAERVLNNTGVRLEFDIQDLERRLPPEIETTLFRTLQEALSNVMRHSGASRVRLSLRECDGVFLGEVDDDGCGFDPDRVPDDGSAPRGLGLLGMRERVSLCDGDLQIYSRPGSGTRIQIRIPLPEVTSG